MSEIKSNLEKLKNQLKELGRPEVKIIAVSKTHGPEKITELLQAGHFHFGENRQNEARDKFPLVDTSFLQNNEFPTYHHIGHLQSGSARQIPGLFHYVHGVSSLKTLSVLMKAADKVYARSHESIRKKFFPIRYLIQLKLTQEETKVGGMTEIELAKIKSFPESEHVIFTGFMTMGPENQEPTHTRKVFQRLRKIRDSLLPHGELSMGMSGDWEIAVSEGATMIRIGTAIFGKRGAGPWKPQT